mgnify:FL=1
MLRWMKQWPNGRIFHACRNGDLYECLRIVGVQVDKEGNISTARVLGLRRLQITDEKWQRAMDALSDSLQVHISKPFVRVYRRGEDGEYQLMNLDVAKV